MVSKEQLVRVTESAIDKLLVTFKEIPYFFYTEHDIHCYVYNEISSSLSLKELRCTTKDERQSILLHKEYPTKTRYKAETLEENVKRGKRGHFDLCIWNPDLTKERRFRVNRSTDFQEEQHTFIAVEFDLVEGSASLADAKHHFKWDIMKLKGRENKVEHGYAFVFVRDWVHRDRFLEWAGREIAEEDKLTIVYAEKKNNQTIIGTLSKRPFSNYKPLFR